MRRALPTAVITLVGLTALLAFKSSSPVVHKVAVGSTAPAPTTTPPATAPPDPTDGTGPTPTTGAAPPPTTAAPATATRTVEGDPFDNQYGTVQVRVTLQGRHINNIEAIQMPFDHARSEYISQQAGPLLQQEVLQAQSAQIDLISGATYTSESYAQSLQSALDKAGV